MNTLRHVAQEPAPAATAAGRGDDRPQGRPSGRPNRDRGLYAMLRWTAVDMPPERPGRGRDAPAWTLRPTAQAHRPKVLGGQRRARRRRERLRTLFQFVCDMAGTPAKEGEHGNQDG